MKKVSILILSVLFTGLFVWSVYAFDPQPEPPGKSQTLRPADSLVTLPDGSKLEFVQRGTQKQVYLIQKNGTRTLADGTFTLPGGKQLTIEKGIILQSR